MGYQQLVHDIVLDDIDQEETERKAMFAALLFMLNNQQDTDEESEGIIDPRVELVKAWENSSRPRKRNYSQVRDETPETPVTAETAETPCPAPRGPQKKIARTHDVLSGYDESVSYDSRILSLGVPLPGRLPNAQATEVDVEQRLGPLYKPVQLLVHLPEDHPQTKDIREVCGDLIRIYDYKASDRDVRIMATRVYRNPSDARTFNLASREDKDKLFEKWVREVKLGQWPPRRAQTQGGVPPRTANMARQPQTSAPVPNRGITSLTVAGIRHVDIRPRPSLRERVSLWLDNVLPL